MDQINKTTILSLICGLSLPVLAAGMLRGSKEQEHRNLPSFGGIKTRLGKDLPLTQVPVKTLEKLDIEKLNSEDARRKTDDPPRFGIVQDIEDAALENWEKEQTDDGALSSVVLRYIFEADEASTSFMAFWFQDLNIPEGVELYITDMDDETNYLGPFTSEQNSLNTPDLNGQNGFMTPAIEGTHRVVMELDLNGAEVGEVDLVLTKVVNGYKNLSHFRNGPNHQDTRHLSGSCMVDAVCPEGNDWTDEINSVGAMTFSDFDGYYVCTGTMLNNGAQDRTPYFLTAHHCRIHNNWVAATLNVYWNYQTETCNDPTPNGRRDQVTSAATYLTSSESTDMTLLRLNSQPPAEYNVAYSGWDRSGNIPQLGVVGIHHPDGNEKSISVDYDATTISGYGYVLGDTHIQVNNWDVGSTAQGSSGAALFDDKHRVVGQLQGGSSECSGSTANNLADWYGRFSVSWENSDLSAYLDPENSGMETLDTLPPIQDGMCDSITTPVCGDGCLTGNEVCDGGLFGGQTCSSVGDDTFTGNGGLSCSGCSSIDTTGCHKYMQPVQTDLADSEGGVIRGSVTLPEDATFIRIHMSGPLEGDADLSVRYGQEVGEDDGEYDCQPYNDVGIAETCETGNGLGNQPGVYYYMISGFTDYHGVSLTIISDGSTSNTPTTTQCPVYTYDCSLRGLPLAKAFAVCNGKALIDNSGCATCKCA